MKYLLLPSAFLLSIGLCAQTFEWDKKGADAGAGERDKLATYEAAYNQRQVGLATEYAPSENGQATAFGEYHSTNELTAGHPVLPLGTLVEVTNLANNKTVSVRINDDAAGCGDCLIKLSGAAADALGVNLKARVAVERTGFSNWNPGSTEVETPTPKTYGAGTVMASPKPAVDQPVTINGEAYGWRAKEVQPGEGARPQLAEEQAPAEATPAPAANANAPTLRAIAANPADYTVAKAPTVASTSEAAPQRSAAVNQSTVRQAAPPAPTVPKYQRNQTIAPPADYAVPTAAQVAKGSPTAAPAPAPPVATSSAESGHVVQLAAYANESYATKRVSEFQANGMENVFYRSFQKPDGSTIHRVYSGVFASKVAAQKAAEYIRDVHQIAGLVTLVE